MLDIFSGLRLVIKRRNISIDNAIFRCHWFFTSTLLVSCSLMITARQYVGQPIECHSVNKIPESLLNSYCWVQSTFTVPQACNLQVGVEVPYPCIDNTRGREVKVFNYYQWVGMVLFIQGLLFHLPYYLWKVWENGLIRTITSGLRVAVMSDQERTKKRNIVIEYIHDHLGCHKSYALKYFLCEFICLLNLLAQLWATNKFFDGQFLRYGLDVMQYSSSTLSSQFGIGALSGATQSPSSTKRNQAANNSTTTITTKPQYYSPYYTVVNGGQPAASSNRHQVDPMTYIFPRITKCTYHDFGSSGDIQKHDAICLLPLNIINEKIYIALWFWFLILALLTILVIIYRLCAILSKNVRCKGLVSRCKLSSEKDIRVICYHCDVGDWFLFYMVAENLDPLVMREIVSSVADKIRDEFELKRRLSLSAGETDSVQQQQPLLLGASRAYNSAQLNPFRFACRPSESFATESATSSRRNSLADEAIPLVKKFKKRFYSKRLWSTDLGSGELRQQLFGRQPATNPDMPPTPLLSPTNGPHPLATSVTGSGGGQGTAQRALTTSMLVSAPPMSEMNLSSAPPPQSLQSHHHQRLQRRASLGRLDSTASGRSDSFVMEMQTISGSTNCLDEIVLRPIEHRHQGSRPPLLRQRASVHQHQSIWDLRRAAEEPSRLNIRKIEAA